VEIGAYTFADVSPDPGGVGPAQRVREVVEEIALADEVGLDVFGVGEHHRSDYAASAPAMILAAGAERSDRIRLTSAVTVLSSDDPVRVVEQYNTLDLLSRGRAEIMAGRGSFTESFPLFGYDLADYDELFAEKLDLLLALRAGGPVTWSGEHRPPLHAASVHPACRTRCRSGWPSAATRTRWSGPGRSGCRWRWPSSAGCPSGSPGWPSCTARRCAAAGTARRR